MIDPAMVVAILGVAGIGVVGITEMIKRFLNASGLLAYVISLVVSAAATVFVLATAHSFGMVPFLLYTVVVFLEANGLYKALSKKLA